MGLSKMNEQMISNFFEKLNTDLQGVLSDQNYCWLKSAFERLDNSDDLINELLTLSAMTRRKLGNNILGEKIDEIYLEDHLSVPIQHWTFAETGRILLILRSILHPSIAPNTVVQSYYQQGDEAEVAAITRGLILLPNCQEFKSYAIEVGRTNSKPLFSAIAHNTPYPAKFYSEPEFNQLVLKALFMDIGIEPILGLLDRSSLDLSRMCEDYIKERIAADRSIPSDIWLALEPFASPYGYSLLIQQLKNSNPEHRYYALKALKQSPPISEERTQLINEHLKNEDNETILKLFSTHN